MSRVSKRGVAALVFFLLLGGLPAHAEVATGTSISSDNFRVLDSQQTLFGGSASLSSSFFELVSVLGNLAIGSASSANFGLRSGFLYFPKVVAPVLNTASAGDDQVALSWTAASAFQGWRIGGYNVCSRPSAGSYSCQNVGAVTSYTKSGLTNGTTYTMKIQALDALGNIIADSNELNATPTGGVAPPPPPSGGGGGGITVQIRGYAYPDARVYILRDARRVAVVKADPDGMFDVTDTVVSSGTFNYSFYAIDRSRRQTPLVSYSALSVSPGSTAELSVILPPTIEVGEEFLTDTNFTIYGESFPNAKAEISFLEESATYQTDVSDDGRYSQLLNTGDFAPGVHYTRARTKLTGDDVSEFSETLGFGIQVPFKRKSSEICSRGDINGDGRMNIIDLSIMAFWYKKHVPQGHSADMNKDGEVNIIDFSVLAFCWTG